MKDADFEELNLNNEKEEDYDLSSKRTIFTEQGDPEVDSLYRRHLKGRLNVQPGFQRQFVWDKVKSSRLIESALLDIPIPIIYLSEEQDGKDNVIDGQQRLTAFFSFIDGKFPDNSDFKLAGLNVFTELNGKKFNELSEDTQDKIMTTKIRVIKFKKESDGELQFEIFARLNTGAVPLNDQELRNCVYRGRFNELLKELSEERDYRYLLGISKPEKRMRDVELVLRFASFYFYSYLDYNAPIKRFLNVTMEKYQNISSEDEIRLRTAFKNTVAIIRSLFGNNAFKRFYCGRERNINGRWETQKFNVSLFDILMYSFAKEDKNTVYQNLDRIREALIDLMTTDQDFIDSIELSTSSKKMVTIRFDKLRLSLQTILGIGTREPRCFSYALKQLLFENDSNCSICGNRILNIDDAAVDHIDQYWTGGKTIPENARLAHRFCNNSRSRFERDENGNVINSIIKDIDVNKNGEEDNIPKKKEGPKIPIEGMDKWRYSFFEKFLAICNNRTTLFRKVYPLGYQNWISTGAGTSATGWTVESWKKFSRISYALSSPSQELNRKRIEVLVSHKNEIEASFGEPLEWHFLESNIQQSIRSNCYLGGIDDEERWPEIQKDLVERLVRLEKVLRPYIVEFSEKGNHQPIGTIISKKYDVSETKFIQQEYWQGLKDYMENHKSFIKMRSPSTQNWSDISIGRSDIYMSAAVYSKRRTIEVWLVFSGVNTKNNFDKLYEIAHDKSLIEINEKIDWDRMDEIKRCAVILRLEADYAKKIDWENQFNWFKENLEKFYMFFKPLIRRI